MDHSFQNQQDDESFPGEEHVQIAIPYVPPPPPDGSDQKKFRSPLVNALLIAVVILLGGFMTYNFVGHQLTKTSAVSNVQTSVVPSISPTVSPSVLPSRSPTPTQSY